MHFCEEFYCLFISFSQLALFTCHISSFFNLFIPRAFIRFHIYQSLHIPLLLMHLKQLFASLCIRLPQFGLLFFGISARVSNPTHPEPSIYALLGSFCSSDCRMNLYMLSYPSLHLPHLQSSAGRLLRMDTLHTRTHVLVAFQTGGLRSRAWVVLGRGTWNKWARDNEDLPIKQRTS